LSPIKIDFIRFVSMVNRVEKTVLKTISTQIEVIIDKIPNSIVNKKHFWHFSQFSPNIS